MQKNEYAKTMRPRASGARLNLRPRRSVGWNVISRPLQECLGSVLEAVTLRSLFRHDLEQCSARDLKSVNEEACRHLAAKAFAFGVPSNPFLSLSPPYQYTRQLFDVGLLGKWGISDNGFRVSDVGLWDAT